MKKIAILLAASLMLVASVSAFARTDINNGASLTVSATNDALVALSPGVAPDNNDATASIQNNVLDISLGKGAKGSGKLADGVPGLQPGSSYAWDQLFFVKNNSAGNIQIHIDVDYPNKTALSGLVTSIKAGQHGYDGTEFVGASNVGTYLPIAPGVTVPVHIGTSIPAGQTVGLLSGSLRVYANSIP